MKCSIHPKYQAKRKPTKGCRTCWIIWQQKNTKVIK